VIWLRSLRLSEGFNIAVRVKIGMHGAISFCF